MMDWEEMIASGRSILSAAGEYKALTEHGFPLSSPDNFSYPVAHAAPLQKLLSAQAIFSSLRYYELILICWHETPDFARCSIAQADRPSCLRMVRAHLVHAGLRAIRHDARGDNVQAGQPCCGQTESTQTNTFTDTRTPSAQRITKSAR